MKLKLRTILFTGSRYRKIYDGLSCLDDYENGNGSGYGGFYASSEGYGDGLKIGFGEGHGTGNGDNEYPFHLIQYW